MHEHFNRYPNISRDDVVYIIPITIGKFEWRQYLALTKSKLCVVQPVTVSVCILFLRH